MAMEVAAAPWLTEARKFVGLKEIVGSRHEPKILQFFAEAGHPGIHDDETAWCAAFVGAMLRRAGYSSSGALNARSYLNFGTKLDKPVPGCIVVFRRGNSAWQGHVGFVDRVLPDGRLMVTGGNQGNAVSTIAFGTAEVLGYRWPLVKSAPAAKSQPKTPAVEKVKNGAKVGGGGIVAGTVATGVEQGWGALEWFIAALVLTVIAAALYGGYRWWKRRRAKQEGIAAVDDALVSDEAKDRIERAAAVATDAVRRRVGEAFSASGTARPRKRSKAKPAKKRRA